jgi:hypothetical protein
MQQDYFIKDYKASFSKDEECVRRGYKCFCVKNILEFRYVLVFS